MVAGHPAKHTPVWELFSKAFRTTPHPSAPAVDGAQPVGAIARLKHHACFPFGTLSAGRVHPYSRVMKSKAMKSGAGERLFQSVTKGVWNETRGLACGGPRGAVAAPRVMTQLQ